MTTDCLVASDFRESAAAPAHQTLRLREVVPAIVAAVGYVLLLPAASVLMAVLTR